MSTAAAGRLRVLCLSPTIPYVGVPHAGGTYLASLARALDGAVDLSYAVPDTPVNRHAVTQPGAPADVLLVGRGETRGLVDRAVDRGAVLASRAVHLVDQTLPPMPFVARLLSDPRVREALRRADVVDLQWSDLVRLAPLVRRLAPRARVVGTLHDVMSQRYGRYADADMVGATPWMWRVNERIARRFEARAVARLDALVVFSEKDRDLLPRSRTVHVVPPAPAVAGPVERRRSAEPEVVFVGHLSRDDNDDAASWLLREIWPAVHADRPGARLTLVGEGATAEVVALAGRDPSVTLAGFVDDLAGVYARAWACVVPVRVGAGVKFKTVEALLAGVPTVATRVGAEGVAGREAFVVMRDDAAGLAAGLVSVLADPDAADRRAEQVREEVAQRFGFERFAATVRRIYLGDEPSPVIGGGATGR